MAQNVEIKIKVDGLQAVAEKASKIADHGPFQLQQVDYFFPVTSGRLKLRVETSDLPDRPNRADLIAYHRSDEATARVSDYILYPTDEPDILRTALTKSLGSGPVVKKLRVLFLIGRTRIHLDRVEGLGDFVEIEVVMKEGEAEAVGRDELTQLVDNLGIANEQVVDVAYADLVCSDFAS